MFLARKRDESVGQRELDSGHLQEQGNEERRLSDHDGSVKHSQDEESVQDTGKNMFMRIPRIWDRQRYEGALLFNLFAFILPALYGTLSKLWIAYLDRSQVVTTDVYTYIGVIVECINEGLPRAAWLIIGDKSSRSYSSRLQLAYTLITFQMIMGTLLSIIFVAASHRVAAAFVPAAVRDASIRYVQISAFSALSSATEYSVSVATRSLDRPDVPLIISSVKFLVNIVLDLLFISKVHVKGVTPTVNTQAIIRLCCDLTASFAGLAYFIYRNKFHKRPTGSLDNPDQHYILDDQQPNLRPTFSSLKVLARPGLFTFTESAIRNALYLWLVHGIISMSADYATAWGVFNTIRWGLVMVPVQSLEASSLAFVGHRWGAWRAGVGSDAKRAKASKREIFGIVKPAFKSVALALVFEVPLCIFFSVWGAESFAFYLSDSDAVSQIAGKMWKTIDWCYIFYATSTQLATVLLATVPRWYLYQSLASNILWVLPWAIVVTKIGIDADTAWKYHSIIFGGSLVISFGIIICVDLLWAWRLLKGRLDLPPVQS